MLAGHSGGFLAGMALGVMVGTVVGILMAPRSGRENRAAALDRAPELRARAPVLARRVIQEVRERMKYGRAAFAEGQADARRRLERELGESQHPRRATP